MKQRSLISVLSGFQKMELEDLANILGQDFRPSMKKSAMVYSLADYLRSNPDRWLSHLTERDIRLLESLVKAGPGKVLYLDFPDYLSFLEAGGIIDYDDSDEDYHRVWISREVYDIVAPHITRVLKRVEKSGRYEVERVGLGYLNLYGIVPYEMFIDLMTSWWETAGGGDIDRLISHLQESPLIKLNRYHDLYGDYLCTPCMSSTEEKILTSAMGAMSPMMLFSPVASSVFWSMMAMRGIMQIILFS